LAAKKYIGKKRERESFTLSETQAHCPVNYSSYSPHSIWFKGKEVVLDSLDECTVDLWIFARSPINVLFSYM
jgi:hypothetical protein